MCGEAGVGKTTFATAAAERAAAAGWSVHWSTCSPEPTVPFEPFVELLASLRDRDPDGFDSSPDADDARQLMPSLPGARPRNDAPTDRDELFDAVTRVLGAGNRPNLILIEDVHWASPLTMRLLGHCLRATVAGDDAAARVRSVLAERTEDAT